jgi:hypothetical protein
MSKAVVKIEMSVPISLEELSAVLDFAIEANPNALVEANYGKITVSIWASDFVLAIRRLQHVSEVHPARDSKGRFVKKESGKGDSDD